MNFCRGYPSYSYAITARFLAALVLLRDAFEHLASDIGCLRRIKAEG